MPELLDRRLHELELAIARLDCDLRSLAGPGAAAATAAPGNDPPALVASKPPPHDRTPTKRVRTSAALSPATAAAAEAIVGSKDPFAADDSDCGRSPAPSEISTPPRTGTLMDFPQVLKDMSLVRLRKTNIPR
ncbi:hypothetical protein HK405_009752 [Cladochytrium tenue]|nr:hypothetical protein HK405_009752 [Cladochytrium tenue]